MKARVAILLAITTVILLAGYLLTRPAPPSLKAPAAEERTIVEPRRIPLH